MISSAYVNGRILTGFFQAYDLLLIVAGATLLLHAGEGAARRWSARGESR